MALPEFHGYDWTELCRALGASEGEEELEATKDILWDAGGVLAWFGAPEEEKSQADEVVQVTRAFVTKLAEQDRTHHYNYPVYEGMLAIEDDWTFLQWVAHSLEAMWT